MEMKKITTAEDLLQKIFYYMNQLVEENECYNTIRLMTELGQNLLNDIRLEITMEMKRISDAEDLLQKIFYYMNQLAEEKDFYNTIRLLTELGQTLVNADRASFWYWDTREKQYWTIAALGTDRIIVPEGSGIVGASISSNETILLNDPKKDPRFDASTSEMTDYPVQSMLCMPVTDSKGRVIGAYQALNKIDEEGNAGSFDDRDLIRLTLAAVYCGKALESHILYTESHMDALTGLLNRRGFFDYCWEHFEQEKLEESMSSISLIMCDIDFFKKVNDTYGHNAGDAVLIYVAHTLRDTLPPKCQAVRWGGEEFVILLEDMYLEQAVSHAEKIRKKIEESVCTFEGEDINITMSFGVKQWEIEKTAAVNIGQVDERLYKAKTSGRNRVISQ